MQILLAGKSFDVTIFRAGCNVTICTWAMQLANLQKSILRELFVRQEVELHSGTLATGESDIGIYLHLQRQVLYNGINTVQHTRLACLAPV